MLYLYNLASVCDKLFLTIFNFQQYLTKISKPFCVCFVQYHMLITQNFNGSLEKYAYYEKTVVSLKIESPTFLIYN